LILRNTAAPRFNHNGGIERRAPILDMTVARHPAPEVVEPYRVFDARSVSRRLRHEIVYDALDHLPAGETFRYIGTYYPIGLMEQLVHRYEGRLTHRFVEVGADRVVIDLCLG
jgi:uncharacterized protein (DUF2249 family)